MNTDTPIKNHKLPNYSTGEEIFNVISHAVGVIFGLAMIIIVSLYHQNITQLLAGILFGLSLTILYSMSCTYHGISPTEEGLEEKRKFQIVDHCSIPILIIGTNIPFALCILEPINPGMGWGIMGIVCTTACIIITLIIIDLNRFKTFTMIGYFLMGGCILVGTDMLITTLTREGFTLFIAGGAAYSIGTIFYKLGGGMKLKWMHSIFHVFCILGSALHYMCICFYVFHF